MAFTVAAMRQQTAGQPLAPPAPEFRNLLPVSMTTSLGRPGNASPARWRGVEAAVGTSADAAHAALIGVQDVGKEAIERIGELLRKR